MASPPFAISTVTPGDSDIVSQFPLNERQVRDIIQSWLLVNHDVNGNHAQLIMPFSAQPATPGSSLITVYADTGGRLRVLYPDATLGWVGLPPGAIINYALGSVPVGWLVADGSAVSRSTYADLFAAISTFYGSGNGSTTFNLPDLRGRVVAGEDSGAGRLTATYFGSTGPFGAVGGVEGQPLQLSHLPTGITSSGNNAISVSTTGNSIPTTPGTVGDSAAGTGANNVPFSTVGIWVGITSLSNPSQAISVTSNNTSAQPHNNMQPTIVLRKLIKT